MSKFQDAMRRVITGDNAEGQSVIIIDGGPSSEIGNPDLGGLFEIWEDAAFGPLMPCAHEDLGTKRPVLGPRKGNFQVRWFVIPPLPEGIPKPQLEMPMMRCAIRSGAVAPCFSANARNCLASSHITSPWNAM